MPKRKFPNGDLYKEHKTRYELGESIWDLAAEVDMRYSPYRKMAQAERWRRPEQPRINSSDKPRYVSPPKFKGEQLIFTDAQIPFHNATFINECIDLALAWGIKSCIGAGDIFDVTAFAAPKYHVKPQDTFGAELSEGRKFVKAIADVFEFHLITGNHEKRFRHFLNEQLAAEEFRLLLKAPENVTTSDYGYCLVENWVIAHPRNVSVIPGRIPFFVSRKYPFFNIACGHGHVQAITSAEDGKRIVIDIGSCADFSKLDWVAMDITTRPAMVNGALILRRSSATKKLLPVLLWDWTDFDTLAKLGPSI